MLRSLADQPYPLTLAQALRLGPAVRLALVGAGGKTSAMFLLGRELLSSVGARSVQQRLASRSVILTTTTHLSVEQCAQADHHFILENEKSVAGIPAYMPDGLLLFTGTVSADGRVGGLGVVGLAQLLRQTQAEGLPLLVEADGARRLPLKAPAAYEPALFPLEDTGVAWMDAVVVMAGLSGLDKPVSSAWVHRPEQFAVLAGLQPGEIIGADALTRVLLHPQGGLKNIPDGVRKVIVLNQADTPALQARVGAIATRLLLGYDAVIVASLTVPETNIPSSSVAQVYAVHERIAGIVLAAGASQRFGQPKQLLSWRGKALVRHVVETAITAGLDPVVVVGGEATDQLRLILADLPAQLVNNPEWEMGQSTSLRAGLMALPQACGGAVFLLADQPHIPTALVRTLVEVHAAGLAPLVAPQAAGRRANPVLFDQQTFPDLLALQGDVGGRVIFSKYPVSWVPWHDASILLDVDTPEDFLKLQELT